MSGLLGMVSNWTLQADLRKQLRFPEEIITTNYRPDIVIFSRSSRICIMIELTVPWEERMEEAYERKMLKYTDLVEQCRTKGWKTWCFPIEIGCRGYPGNSSWRALKMLGIVGKDRRKLLKDAGDNAETASMWIWRRRLECSPGETPHGTESTTNRNCDDHPHSLASTTIQADGRNGGDHHLHSLASTTNQASGRNGDEDHPHSRAQKN